MRAVRVLQSRRAVLSQPQPQKTVPRPAPHHQPGSGGFAGNVRRHAAGRGVEYNGAVARGGPRVQDADVPQTRGHVLVLFRDRGDKSGPTGCYSQPSVHQQSEEEK